MGQAALKRVIDVAIEDGRLQVEPGKDKFLEPRMPIAKAKPDLPVVIADK